MGWEGTTMTMHVATVLHFLKFPRVSNRPQQTVDGRAWQIVKIEAPFCWAQPYGSGGPLQQYLVQGAQGAGTRGRPRQSGPETIPEPEAVPEPEPEAASGPIPAPPEEDDQRLYRKTLGKAAFIDMGRSAIVSGVLAPPD
jgi:hypothetical protein